MNRTKRFLLCLLVLGVMDLPLFAQDRPAGAGAQKVRQFQSMLQQARSQGVDTRAAEQFDRLSRAAAREGDEAEARRLLDQAIEALQASGVSSPAAQPPARGPRGGAAQRNEPEPLRKPPSRAGVEQPVFILPFTHHYHGPGGYYASAAQVREIAEFFHSQGIPGTLFFDGILVDRLLREDPGLISQIKEWNLPIGYHGEETHGPYPVASELLGEVYTLKEAQGYRGPWSLTTGADWTTAVQRVVDRYSHARPYTVDETTRMLDRRASSETDYSRVGGLKLVQETLGKDVSMMTSHGLESAPEGYAFRRMSRFGFDQPAVPTALHALRIFRIDELAEQAMSIAGKDESLFWYMGRLTCKGDDIGESGSRLEMVRRQLDTLDRSRPRLLLMGFSKNTSEEGGRTVQYLNDEFFPANPGSAWVSGETLPGHFEPEKAYRPTASDLATIAASLVSGWSARPPDYVVVGGRAYSLCDAFEGFARALSARSGNGGLPPSVELNSLYGPVMQSDAPVLASATEVSPAEVSAAAAAVASSWDQSEGDRFVPARVRVAGVTMNCGEFLLAMAKTAAGAAGSVTNRISVSPSKAFPPYGDVLDGIFKEKAVQPVCYTKGQLWTVKAARLRSSTAASTASPATTEQTGKLRLVFAANLDSDLPCFREDHAGADLYRADFDMPSGRAENVQRLTAKDGQAEWFPALSPDGRYVVYDAEERGAAGPPRRSLRVLLLDGGTDGPLVDGARFAAISADGRKCFYSIQSRAGQTLYEAPLMDRRGAPPILGEASAIADNRFGANLVEDPSPFPDGRAVAFHLKDDEQHGAGVAVVNTDGTGFQKLTPPDGCGHAAVSPDGKTVACTRSRDGRVVLIRRDGERWLPPEELPLSTNPADYLAMDSRFGQVKEVRHSYVEWVTPDILLVTSHGSNGGKAFLFARLFLVRLPTDGRPLSCFDLSGAIEKAVGETGKDFCSADAVVIR